MNNSVQQIPVGYKNTEIGFVPVEWVEKSFGDICTVNQGLQIPIEERKKTQVEGSKVYITIQYLNSLDLPEFISNYTPSVCCDEGDILMTRTGNTGIVVHGVSGVFHNNFFKIRFDRKKINDLFLVYVLRSHRCQRTILEKSGTSTIPDLNHGDFYSIKLALPDYREQTAIATALSDVDALIQELEKLIAKKQAIKTATMQQLLTGRTRLPQFAYHPDGRIKGYKPSELGEIPEDWEIEPLGKSHTLATGTTPPTSNLKNYGGRYLFVSPADLSDSKYIIKTEKHLSDNGFHLARIFPSGSTLFTCIGSTIGKTGLAREELTSNQQINAIFPNDESDHEFIYYAITYIAPRIKALAGQQAVPLVNKSEFGETVFCFPNCKNEQTAIATILSDMDEEIQAMAQRLNKTRQIKQGMMQELLTGKTRLIKPESRA